MSTFQHLQLLVDRPAGCRAFRCISRLFGSDIALALHGANSAKNQTQPEDAIPGNDTRGGYGPAHVVRNPSCAGPARGRGSRLNNFVRSELPRMPRRRTSVTAPMTVQPASHPSIAATQSPSTASAESMQTTGPKKAIRANAVHAAKAKIARRNSLRMQRLLQKQSRV